MQDFLFRMSVVAALILVTLIAVLQFVTATK